METESLGQKRRPRFRRQTGQFNIRLNERDLAILKLVYEYRFLSSAHIRVLVAGSDQKITKRLQKLFHEGYLDRPREQGAHAFGKTNYFVYGLGRAGALALAEAYDIDFSKIEWTAKNREAKQRYIWHSLMIANFRTALSLALRNNTGAELLFWQQGSELKDDFVLSERGKSRRFVVFPDAFFGLKDKRGKMYFFLEADRSTMQGERYLRKLKGYWSYWQERKHVEKYGINRFRVLTTTISEKRSQNLRVIARRADDQEKGSLMFWFTCEKNYGISGASEILGPIWQTPVDNKKHHLLE